jgi:hypothetical protein
VALLTAPTLQRLILDVRNQLNQPNESNSFWKNPEITSYINDAIQKYFLDVNGVAEGQFDAAVSLDLVANSDTVALPSTCFEVRALYTVQSDHKTLLRYHNSLTESIDLAGAGGAEGYSPYYYFRGNSLILRPMPAFNQTGGLYLEYTQFPETLITGQDSMTSGISPVFKELVVMYAVYKCKIKESMTQGGDTYLPAERHLSSLYGTFTQQLAGRSKYPQSIVPFGM